MMKPMKPIVKTLISAAAAVIMAWAAGGASAQTWNFTATGDADIANLAADPAAWEHELTSSNDRYKSLALYDRQPLRANGQELQLTAGLLFTAGQADAIRIDIKGKRMAANKPLTITIPGLKAGMTLAMSCKTSSKTTARGFNVTNLKPVEGCFNATSLDEQRNVATVVADGDVTLANTGGMYVYSLTVTDPSAGGPDAPAADHSVPMDMAVNQARLTTTGGVVKYYNTADLSSIGMDREAGTVTVTPRSGEWSDVFTRSIATIGFAKAQPAGGGAEVTTGGVEITEAGGWLESAYVEWKLAEGAESYNVYVRGGPYADFTRLDRELVRNYGTYGRADAVGLPAAGGYELRVVPVSGGAEQEALAATASAISVSPYDRAGYAWMGRDAVGAYRSDGTLRPEARVLYVTGATAKTVELPVVTESNGKEQTFTGLQAIINAYQKGRETRPLCVRIVGLVRAADMDALLSSEGLQVKGKNNTTPLDITIEGIGRDAAIWGFGLLLRNALSVELRNFGVMLCLDDAVSVDTNNKHCWIHNLDLFYGQTGGDSDQAKGDGTVDIKGKSTNITVAYCHFFDSGKSSLCGMKSESADCLIDYHHNWFDHSDSRHPRVRTMTVHVWNNYYDGCAKYGVGATMGASVFAEANFFRATKNPMLISRQGTDAEGDGTFSGEDGGIIKSYANLYAETSASGSFTPITQHESATGFDCYEAATRSEQVPPSVVTLAGGTPYNNFDTDPARIYDYTPLPAADVPAAVTGWLGAGRMGKGDFSWAFDNAGADRDYGVDTALKAALEGYEPSLVGFF